MLHCNLTLRSVKLKIEANKLTKCITHSIIDSTLKATELVIMSNSIKQIQLVIEDTIELEIDGIYTII